MRVPGFFNRTKALEGQVDAVTPAEVSEATVPPEVTAAAYNHLAKYTLGILTEHGSDVAKSSRRSLRLTHGIEKKAAQGWLVELAVDYPEASEPTALERIRQQVKYDREADLSTQNLAIDFNNGDKEDSTVICNVLFRGKDQDKGLVRFDTAVEKPITDLRSINSLGRQIGMAVAAAGIETVPYEPFVVEETVEAAPALPIPAIEETN